MAPIEEPVLEETKEERSKRVRKEASKRMQQKFKERLYARTSGIIEQINSKPDKSSKEKSSSTHDIAPQPRQTTTITDRSSASLARGSQDRNVHNQRQMINQPHEEAERINERGYVDWLIAVIVMAILAILYRRAAAYMQFLPGSVPSNDGNNEEQSDIGLLHNVDDI